jgi:hypothetical protein
MIDALDDVRRVMPQIDKAASEVGRNLSRTGVLKDIALAAELAGLMLLRQANPKIPDLPPGTKVVGMTDPELLKPMNLFMASNAYHLGITQKDVESVSLPIEAVAYCADLGQYEPRFREICRSHDIRPQHLPFVAAFSAVKFVGGGAQIGIIDKKLGFALALYHLGAGCNTVPYPAEATT